MKIAIMQQGEFKVIECDACVSENGDTIYNSIDDAIDLAKNLKLKNDTDLLYALGELQSYISWSDEKR